MAEKWWAESKEKGLIIAAQDQGLKTRIYWENIIKKWI